MTGKKILLIFGILILILCSMVVNAANDDITLIINGKKITSDVSPLIINDRTMVPVRVIMESLGADVEWNSSLRQAVVMSDGKVLIFTIDSHRVYVGSDMYMLDTAPIIVYDRTLVPLRFIAETLGFSVGWNGQTRTVTVDGALKGAVSDSESDEIKDVTQVPQTPIPDTPSNSDLPDNSNNNTSSPGGALLSSITAENSAGSYAVTVKLSSKTEPKVSKLTSPYRLVFDFYDVKQTCSDSNKKYSDYPVNEIRWAKHEGYSRLVIETKSYQSYTLSYTGNDCIIKLNFDQIDEQDNSLNIPSTDTPSQNSPTVSEKNEQVTNVSRPKNEIPIVVIDPGHGGFDSGAVGKDKDDNIIIKEKELNFDISQRVVSRLQKYNVCIMMTRTTDKALGSTIMEDLVARAEFANKANADLFVSIHNNAFTDPEATGTCVLYAGLGNSGGYGITGEELAQNIQTPLLEATGLYDRGIVPSPQIVVLKRTMMPAALVECGFVTCETDQKVLTDNEAIDKIADAICEGIVVSLKKMGILN